MDLSTNQVTKTFVCIAVEKSNPRISFLLRPENLEALCEADMHVLRHDTGSYR